jgi:hypothetical protein
LPLLWPLAEQYVLAGTLRDIADELEQGDSSAVLILIKSSGSNGGPVSVRVTHSLALHTPAPSGGGASSQWPA